MVYKFNIIHTDNFVFSTLELASFHGNVRPFTIRKKSYYFLTVLSRYIDHFLTVSTKLTVNQNFSKGFLLATI